MYTRRGSYTAVIFIIVYLIEFIVVDQIHLPLGGFSLFLIFVLSWSALSSPEIGAIGGFFGDDSLRGSPLSLVVFVAGAVVIAICLYVLLNSLLGLEVGNLRQLIRTIIGNGLWTLAIAPFVLPVASRLHRSIFETREFQ